MKTFLKLASFSAIAILSVPTWCIEWQSCRIQAPNSAYTVSANCASYSVPENRTDISRDAKLIQLNIAFISSPNKNQKEDPILFLAGGPGQSSVESFVQIQFGFDQLLKNRNVYLVDQRGTGKSNPLHCTIDPTLFFKSPSDEESLNIIKQCLAELKSDTRYYTTTESIKDLEEVRKALNIKQWNLIGVSYGTRKALTYAKLFPDSIRSMVLDGVAPQQEALGEKHEENLLSALELQFNECKNQPACNEKFGDVSTTLNQLLSQADKQPSTIMIPHPVSGKPTEVILTREVLTMVIRMFAYTPDNYRLLPLLLNLANNGRPEPIASQALMIFNALSDSITFGMDLSVICAEDAPFYTSTSNATAFFGKQAMSEMRKKQCELWPHTKVDRTFKEPVVSNIPSLLLSGELDPVTPPNFADKAAQTLAHSQHFIAKGFGHGVFMRGCMPYVIRDFIDTPMDKLDTKCMDNFATPPFFIDLMGPKQ